jgi:hypothetical protein
MKIKISKSRLSLLISGIICFVLKTLEQASDLKM